MPKKKREYYQYEYQLEEDEMQSLIAGYKKGDLVAQQKLLDVFSNFLSQYTTLLYYCRYKLDNYDLRCFIALYIKDPVLRGYLFKNKLNPLGQKRVHEEMQAITNMIHRYDEYDDVDQTVKLAFFACIDRYTPTESERGGIIPFAGFLYRYYYYVLKKLVDQMLISQLGRKTFPLLVEEDSEESDQPGFFAPGIEDVFWSEEVDEKWVAGDTCSFPFDQLTVQERQLIKWRYVDKDKSADIAYRVTEHISTIREAMVKIRIKLKTILEQDMDW